MIVASYHATHPNARTIRAGIVRIYDDRRAVDAEAEATGKGVERIPVDSVSEAVRIAIIRRARPVNF